MLWLLFTVTGTKEYTLDIVQICSNVILGTANLFETRTVA